MDGGIEQPTQALEASKQDVHAGTTTEVVDGVEERIGRWCGRTKAEAARPCAAALRKISPLLARPLRSFPTMLHRIEDSRERFDASGRTF